MTDQNESPHVVSPPVAKLNARIAAQALRFELEKHFVPGTTFETFKQSLREHVASLVRDELEAVKHEMGAMLTQHLQEANQDIGDLLRKHLETLRAEHPTAAAVLDYIARGLSLDDEPTAPAPAPASPPDAVSSLDAPSHELVAWPPPLDGEFPTPEAFAALGFYPETYAHQLAEWQARKNPPPAAVEQTSDVLAPQTTQENSLSDAATSTGSETA